MTAVRPVNILLVDDQPAKLLAYEAILEPLGENLIKASSGTEALQHLLKSEIAVVLIDVCMPQLDGFELASMIREHPRHRRAAIIFVSAIQVSEMDQLRGYEVGGVDYVSVPIVPQILRARVSVFADLYRKTLLLEQLNSELENRVAERTAALESSSALIQRSEEALRDSDRMKDQFLATLAHELRNPLAPIRNAIEYARRRGLDDPELRWSHDMIDRQVDHLTRLVDDLLDVGRITRGRLEIRRERCDVSKIVKAAVESTAPVLRLKQQELHVALPLDPVPLDVDVVRLNQILVNLIDNASKFTPERGSVWLVLERRAQEVEIRVRDSGIGVQPEELPRLFEMFYQPVRVTRASEGGLGIGLSLAHRLVEMHGGSLQAFSEGRNRGSEFVIRLPVAKEMADTDRKTPVNNSVLKSATSSPPRRILVVDDNRDAADSLAALLALQGHEVRTAYEGQAAIDLAAEFGAEVVLLDIGLPLTDGYAVAEQIRAAKGGSEVFVVAVTGWGQQEDLRRSREAGFDAHLVKPVDTATLKRLLAKQERVVPLDANEPAPTPEAGQLENR